MESNGNENVFEFTSDNRLQPMTSQLPLLESCEGIFEFEVGTEHFVGVKGVDICAHHRILSAIACHIA